jgi:hypothetical protein
MTTIAVAAQVGMPFPLAGSGVAAQKPAL